VASELNSGACSNALVWRWWWCESRTASPLTKSDYEIGPSIINCGR
jgi:hypothetical protein